MTRQATVSAAGIVTALAPAQAALPGEPRFRADARRRRMLAAADLGAVAIASGAVAAVQSASVAWRVLAFAPLWIVVAKLCGLYDRDHRSLRHLTVDDLSAIFFWAFAGGAALTLVYLPFGGHRLASGSLLVLWSVLVVSALGLRSSTRYLWRRTSSPERLLVLGTGELVGAIRRKLELFPDIHATVAGHEEEPDPLAVDRWSGRVDRVVYAGVPPDERVVRDLGARCREHGLKLSVVAGRFFGEAMHVTRMADLPLFEFNTWDTSRSTMLVKRVLDLAVAIPLLVVLSPLLLVVAVAVKLSSPGPILFVQRRAGLGGEPFTVLKFRTMVDDAERLLAQLVMIDQLPEPMFKLERDPRVTRVGALLRRSSIDELPQLVNVIRGEMSLVGPRPEQLDLVARYRPEHLFRLTVKPGLTGPMQIFGRGSLTFEERLAVERDYVSNISLGRDLRIVLLTLAPLLTGHGAY